MRVKLPLGWPDSSEPRYEEKRSALGDLGLQPAPEWDAAEVVLPLDADEPAAAANAVVDALRILGATDLELCFWPPSGEISTEEARHAVDLLRPSTDRRALLSARRALRAAVASARESHASDEELAFTAVLTEVQTMVDAFCAGVSKSEIASGGVEQAYQGADLLPVLDMSATGGTWAHPALRARELSGRGHGIVATSSLASGEEVLRCPEGALLNVFTALQSETFGAAACLLLADGLHPETVSMLFAVSEHRRCCRREGTGSPWADMLARAPSLDDMPQLMAWPVEAVEALGSTQVASEVQAALTKLWELSSEVKEAVGRLPEVPAQGLGGAIGFDDLLWARCLFDGRAVGLKISVPSRWSGDDNNEPPQEAQEGWQWILLKDVGDTPKTWVPCPLVVPSLAPGVDFLNHDIRGALASPAFNAERRELVVETVAAITAETELCLCYGGLQNFELLMHYGFCPEENPHDRLTVGVDPPTDDTACATRNVLLQLHGIPTEHVLRPALPRAAGSLGGWAAVGVLPPQLLRCLRVLVAEEPQEIDVDALPGFIPENDAAASGDVVSLDQHCLQVLEDLLGALLEQFGAIVEEPKPFWWPLHGETVAVFRASQHALASTGLAAVADLRKRLDSKKG